MLCYTSSIDSPSCHPFGTARNSSLFAVFFFFFFFFFFFKQTARTRFAVLVVLSNVIHHILFDRSMICAIHTYFGSEMLLLYSGPRQGSTVCSFFFLKKPIEKILTPNIKTVIHDHTVLMWYIYIKRR